MKVYKYIVCWRDGNFPFVYDWKHKSFAQKKDAIKFAIHVKNKDIKPYPYIYRIITDESSFKKGIQLEYCKVKYDILGVIDYIKYIKYNKWRIKWKHITR